MIKVVSENDLNQNDFTVTNGKLNIKSAPRKWQLNWRNARSNNADDSIARKHIALEAGGIGKIHLDFMVSTSAPIELAMIPAGAPVPFELMEVQVASGGSVWCDAGSRYINGAGLSPNTRIIVDMVGFFR